MPIFSKICVLFLIFGIGAMARARNVITEGSIRDLCKVVLMVTLPFLYFETLATRCTSDVFRTIWDLPVFALIFVTLAYVLGDLVSRSLGLDRGARATFVYLATFTNCGFLAIPIAHMLYGEDGVLRVILFNVGFNLLYWTIGVATLRKAGGGETGEGGIAHNLLNSGTIGMVLGLAAGLLALKLPVIVLDTTRIVGAATIPLALLVIGAIMAAYRGPVPAGYKRALAVLVALRLIAVPLIALFVTDRCAFLPELSRAVIVLQCAMPSASSTPIFVKRFGGDIRMAGLGVFVTTLCGIITIPLIMALL